MKPIKFILPVVLLLTTVCILLFRPELLTTSFYGSENMPLGTLISWIGIVAYAWVLYLVRPIRKKPLLRISRNLLFLNFFAAVFWGFFSYLLAGNWQFNFSKQFNFYIWIFYSAAIILLPISVYLIWIIKRAFKN